MLKIVSQLLDLPLRRFYSIPKQIEHLNNR